MSTSPICWPLAQGRHSPQAHADLPAGSYEREMGRDGFAGPACHFHHAHPPTGWTAIDGELRPRAFDFNALPGSDACPWSAPLLLGNRQLAIRQYRAERPTPLVRDADGDLLLFVHAGAGTLFCDWGRLDYRDGDYLLLPRGTLWRLEPATPGPMLLIEAIDGRYDLPDKGLLGRHALFDTACLRTPVIDDAFLAQQGDAPTAVRVKRFDRVSTLRYPFNPLDSIGWHGDLCAFALNWRDIRPVMSHRYHLPPTVHATFFAPGFMISTFVPRPLESDPGALKLPFFHSSDDYDEFIFYHAGEFMSRDHIYPGMATLHPTGLPHGPHPKAFATAAAGARAFTDEVAVMVDSRKPLLVAPLPDGVEWTAYADSWKG